MGIEDQIKNHLFSLEPVIDWKKELISFSDRASECNKNLKKILFSMEYREIERAKKCRRIPLSQLDRKWEDHLNKLQKEYSGDSFYFPGDCVNKKGQTFYFNDHNTNGWLSLLMTPTYKVISKNLSEMRKSSLALKKIFSLLAEGEELFFPRIFYFCEILEKIENIAVHEGYKVVLAEMKSNNKSRSAISIPRKIERYKRHESYKKIEEILIRRESIEQVTQLDRALVQKELKNITSLKDRALRDHRDLIIEDFFNKD